MIFTRLEMFTKLINYTAASSSLLSESSPKRAWTADDSRLAIALMVSIAKAAPAVSTVSTADGEYGGLNEE